MSNLSSRLVKIPGVEKVGDVRIENNIVKNITIQNKTLGKLTIESLDTKDALQLFNFYFHGLSKKSRTFFPPYPLFSPIPKDPEDLANKIKDWKKESDWTVLKLSKDGEIIGICLLKRYRTKRPTSGLAIHEKFQKMGLGFLLQTIINEQAQMLGLKKIVITLAQDNITSSKMHEKAGFKKTKRLVPHFTYVNGVKKIDRYDIEMIKRFNYR